MWVLNGNVNYFRVLFESLPDYRKIVLLIYHNKDDKNLLREVGFSQRDNNLLNVKYRNILIKQYEEYLIYIND